VLNEPALDGPDFAYANAKPVTTRVQAAFQRYLLMVDRDDELPG
jgi:hypothetical protein